MQKMNKESMIFRTHEIKARLLRKISNPIDSLFFYIKEDNFQKFKEIIEKYRIYTEAKDTEGNTFLNIAVQCNSLEITEYLLKRGAEVNTANVSLILFTRKHLLNTPLHYALAHKNFNISDMLIKRDADEKVKNKLGLFPWQCITNSESIH